MIQIRIIKKPQKHNKRTLHSRAVLQLVGNFVCLWLPARKSTKLFVVLWFCDLVGSSKNIFNYPDLDHEKHLCFNESNKNNVF